MTGTRTGFVIRGVRTGPREAPRGRVAVRCGVLAIMLVACAAAIVHEGRPSPDRASVGFPLFGAVGAMLAFNVLVAALAASLVEAIPATSMRRAAALAAVAAVAAVAGATGGYLQLVWTATIAGGRGWGEAAANTARVSRFLQISDESVSPFDVAARLYATVGLIAGVLVLLPALRRKLAEKSGCLAALTVAAIWILVACALAAWGFADRDHGVCRCGAGAHWSAVSTQADLAEAAPLAAFAVPLLAALDAALDRAARFAKETFE